MESCTVQSVGGYSPPRSRWGSADWLAPRLETAGSEYVGGADAGQIPGLVGCESLRSDINMGSRDWMLDTLRETEWSSQAPKCGQGCWVGAPRGRRPVWSR